ncbi:MAG TPA: shikimate kinase AroL, partial [Desulfosarcina sp.]|nr:shikimate kinase AroL [Desulfosarcina sp.]
MNLYLIGYRCTGKTTVGRRVADELGWAFTDADEALEKSARRSVSDIVRTDGWQAFRNLESRILTELADYAYMVVATGGGVILRPENVTLMRQTGRIIWLTASPRTILSRMTADPKTERLRPSLTDQSVRDEVLLTLSERLPLYQNAADDIIDTDDRPVNMICRDILKTMSPAAEPAS